MLNAHNLIHNTYQEQQYGGKRYMGIHRYPCYVPLVHIYLHICENEWE